MSNWKRSKEYGRSTYTMGNYEVYQTVRESLGGRWVFWAVEINGERITEQQRCSEAKTFAELHSEGRK
jgi:hypothetical protein